MTQDGQPVGIQEVNSGSKRLPDGNHTDRNRVTTTRILPAPVAQTETGMLETVLQYGTGKAASIGQFAAGKTGTTSNYGDAWFVGWDSKYTVAVWVGYPEKLVPMTTDFDGGPVLGGTFPALIWHNFMTSALQIDSNREAEHQERRLLLEGSAPAPRKAPPPSTTQGSGSGQELRRHPRRYPLRHAGSHRAGRTRAGGTRSDARARAHPRSTEHPRAHAGARPAGSTELLLGRGRSRRRERPLSLRRADTPLAERRRRAFPPRQPACQASGLTMFSGDPSAKALIWLNTSLNWSSHSSRVT